MLRHFNTVRSDNACVRCAFAAVLWLCLLSKPGFAAELPDVVTLPTSSTQSMQMTRINPELTPITVDGHLHEPVWQTIPVIDDFVVLEPDTLEAGVHPTFLRVAYSD